MRLKSIQKIALKKVLAIKIIQKSITSNPEEQITYDGILYKIVNF
jgi:hypothetical protein